MSRFRHAGAGLPRIDCDPMRPIAALRRRRPKGTRSDARSGDACRRSRIAARPCDGDVGRSGQRRHRLRHAEAGERGASVPRTARALHRSPYQNVSAVRIGRRFSENFGLSQLSARGIAPSGRVNRELFVTSPVPFKMGRTSERSSPSPRIPIVRRSRRLRSPWIGHILSHH